MAGFCPGCGTEIPDGGSKFCFSCGAELPPGESGTPPADATIKIPASAGPVDAADVPPGDETTEILAAVEATSQPPQPGPDDTAVMPPAGPPPPPPPTGPHSSSYPWKWILLIAIAGIILAAGAGAGLAYFTGKDDQSSSKATKTDPKTDKDEKDSTSTRTSKTRTSKTNTATTRTSRTSASSETQAYVSAMDELIAENAQLEQQIGVMADEINRVAPSGISDSLLSEIDTLSINFLAINNDAQDLTVPAAFGQAQQDFLQLTSYNMDRCNALYAGATFWRAGQPYQSSFEEGRVAKDAYQALYPIFEDEYAAAQAPLR